MDKTPPVRQTAKHCSITELLNGEYIVQEGWKPNYIQTKNRKLSRVNIIGVVVEKQTPFQFLLDDGTATITVTDFNQLIATRNLKVGHPVLVIGRPRQAENTLFLAAEAVNSTQLQENPQWLVSRKEELVKLASNEKDDEFLDLEEVHEETNQEDEDEEETPTFSGSQVTGDDIVDFIKKKDNGEGCLVEDIIAYFGQETDDAILNLITVGEIFEVKPGRVKVLE